MVSVIVPVYNVEKYVRQCLDSLKAQTLEEVEFIIIDDGSTDGCGAICDKYEKDDKRFRVFHTENRGLSAARNRGIDESYGEWIMFVDSDDFVNEKFCEVSYKAAIENNADLVIFQFSKIYENGKPRRKKIKRIPLGAITHEQAIDYGTVAVWNKLYKKDLFSENRYPEDHVCEDIANTHRLIYHAESIIMISDTLIYYRFRKGSIAHKKTTLFVQDLFYFRVQKYNDLVRFGYPEAKAKKSLQKGAISYCFFTPRSSDYLYKYAEKILSEIQDIPRNWHWKKRIALLLWKKAPTIFHFVSRLVNGIVSKQGNK